MFCHKCGTEIAEGAGFCHKCGTKVASTESVSQPESQQENEDADFRAFVDDHVRTTTRFQSAEDLLKRKKTLLFLIPCFVIPAILFYRGGLVALVGGTLLFGHGARYIVGTIIRSRCTAKTRGCFRGKIDPKDLCGFLNKHLKYLEPYFHDWQFMPGRGYALTLGADPEEVNIGSTFGPSRRCTAVICIRPDPKQRDLGEMQYLFASTIIEKKSKLLGILEWTTVLDVLRLFIVDESKHVCLMKSAPVLQAAMEYYLKNYANNQGGNEHVLH